MNLSQTTQFKAEALSWDTLRHRAPSIFAPGPMQGVSDRYAFVPTARIVAGLRETNWVPVDVEEQRIRQEKRRGFQKHLLRFRLAAQIESLDEWNIELVLVNSHDGGCAYRLHAGIYRRICSNGLVVQENLIRGGVADGHRDRRGRLRSVRGLRGIDSRVDLNKGLWDLAERLANGEPLDPMPVVSVTV